MPRTVVLPRSVGGLLDSQDGVVSVGQLESHGLTRNFADKRVARGSWQRMLPGVYLARAGERNRRQMLVASSLYGGPSSAVDGVDALRWHGYDGPDGSGHQVHIVVPWGQSVRSKHFVVVRRALAEITVAGQGCVPYVDAATAAIVAARNARHFGAAVAVLSRSLQLGLVTVDTLRLARESIGDKWCRPVDGALETVGVGVRSPAESDLRKLIRTSPVLPEPQWNVWLDLGDGGPLVCVDALWEEAGMTGEVIGKKYHAWGQAYDDTNARRERVQAAGLVVCEATPVRIRRYGAAVLRDLERVYQLNAGRGLPPNVRVLLPPSIAE